MACVLIYQWFRYISCFYCCQALSLFLKCTVSDTMLHACLLPPQASNCDMWQLDHPNLQFSLGETFCKNIGFLFQLTNTGFTAAGLYQTYNISALISPTLSINLSQQKHFQNRFGFQTLARYQTELCHFAQCQSFLVSSFLVLKCLELFETKRLACFQVLDRLYELFVKQIHGGIPQQKANIFKLACYVLNLLRRNRCSVCLPQFLTNSRNP